MGGYKPLYIRANNEGLIQSRQEFILPDDAYPTLENAFVWRERIKRKQGYQLLGRLRRTFLNISLGNSSASVWSFNLYSFITTQGIETNKQIQPGSVTITIQTGGPGIVFVDNGLGVLTSTTGGNSGTINYQTGAVALTHTAGALVATVGTFNYYPNLPVMGIRDRELFPPANDITVFFDRVYAYNFTASGFVEFIPGTTWTGSDSQFFWTTNYWVDTQTPSHKIFWATNFSGTGGDPIRYTNGSGNATGNWVDFTPTINAAGDTLNQCLALLPFRGRLVAFNTLEGPNLAGSTSFTNRIRWAAIGTPFDTAGAIPVDTNPNAWRDDIRGQGGYLNIPTNEDIVSVGFVRDNLVIFCEKSTWQLRYTGRTIAPFQIEKVNTQLGAFGTFSAVQFDTSLIGIGNRGVVECDSYKTEKIDIKIPDLVMEHFNQNNQGQIRVHGVRDFFQRLAFWIYPESDNNGTFPDRRLVYNVENDSWAIFTDSLTTLGNFLPLSSRTWVNPSGGDPIVKVQWKEANFPWVDQPSLILSVVGGNQQGYVEYLDQQTTNDESLTITAITGNTTTPTQITSPNHNLQTGQVISIVGIPTGTGYANLNGLIFGVVVLTANTFLIYLFNPSTQLFDKVQLDAPATYIGGGQIKVRDGFNIISKKFNFMEQDQNIQLGFLDILMESSVAGAITMNIYLDYNDNAPSNVNDPFFNTIIPTSPSSLSIVDLSKTMQRVFCPTRGNFITIQYTLSNAQLNGTEQENNVQIDLQVLHMRPAGRIGNL